MKTYPSIVSKPSYNGIWYVFDKLDGSNIRAEWSRAKGFYKFGSRKQLIGGVAESDQQTLLARSEGLIREQEDTLARVFRAMRWERSVAFFEFLGPSSFAGLHEASEEQRVVLFDVDVYKHGLVDPREFVAMFEDVVETPALLQSGTFSKEDEAAVRAGTFAGVTSEGVVAKSRRYKKWQAIDMFKVKSQAWIDRVKARYGANSDAL